MRSKGGVAGKKAGRLFYRKRQLKGWGMPVLLGILILGVWLHIDKQVRPAAEKLCAYQCRSIAQEAISEGVERTISALAEMQPSLTSAVYQEDGTLAGLHTDATAMNTVQLMLVQNVNAALEEKKTAEFQVSTGSLTGMYTLIGRGPEIPLRFCPAGTAEIVLDSEFSSAGINQTLHRLTAEITVEAGCTIPLYHGSTTEHFTYLLSETLINGEVPEIGGGLLLKDSP